MPISALPSSTVRLLGSSVTITTPCDLVKELVDNAIDAKASSIEVTLSHDAIDKITVRDDGHGIDVDDFDSLGRRTYTSKLRTFDELSTRAGETLGFRGEALAAANSLATVTVTTRTTCDPVASRLQLKSGVGGVESRRSVSAPVGTTTHATKLFESLPARKQYALKNSHRSISAIKELLRAYALARPYLRLSLKVAGDSAHSWTYAPNNSSTVHEAVLQILGRNLATNCVQASHTPVCDQPAGFILEAFIPKSNFDAQAIKSKGAYISVDFRPVSSARGIFKKIVGIFKSHLGRIRDTKEPATVLASPFIQLNIRCPPCSYDPNVTPLKDEVVFADEKRLLDSFETLCQKVYRTGGDDAPWKCEARPDVTARMEAKDASHPPARAESAFGSDLNDGFSGPCEATSHQLQDPPKEPEIVSARMRTERAVNMSRTESNTTDENSAVDSVMVQIPRLPTLNEASSSQSRSKIRPKLSAISHGSENIERYFRPGRNEEFHIASDETATMGEQQSILDSTQPQSRSGRLPLQPLSESALNEMEGRAESGSDASIVEFGIVQPVNASRRDLRPAITRRRLGVTDSRGQEGMRWQRRTPPDSSSPVPPPRRQGDFRSPRELPDVLGLQTPPSSDPSRREGGAYAPFRPPRRGNVSVGSSAQARRSGGESNDNGVQTGLLRRTRVSLRSVAYESSGQQGRARPEAIYEPVVREGTFPGVQEIAHHGNYSPSHDERRQLHERTDSSSDVFRLASQDEALTRDLLPQEQNRQYSHMLQTILMKSPSPVVSSAREDAEGTMPSCEDHRANMRNDTPAPDIFSRNFSHGLASHDVTGEDGEDPRRYLIKRQRSRARHGRVRRLSSRRLPLEAVPDAMKLHDISTRLEVRSGDVRLWAQRFGLLERNTASRHFESSLDFRGMEETRTVEARLRAIVDSWMERENSEWTVEYTLRRAAKGKDTC